MSIDDNWGEALRKSAEVETPGDKSETRFKARVTGLPLPPGVDTATPVNVTVTTASTEVRPANPTRNGLALYNDGGGNVYVKLGTGASSTSFTVRVPDNGYYEFPKPVYRGAVHAAAASGSRVLRVTEW